jgi:hypothetical protein
MSPSILAGWIDGGMLYDWERERGRERPRHSSGGTESVQTRHAHLRGRLCDAPPWLTIFLFCIGSLREMNTNSFRFTRPSRLRQKSNRSRCRICSLFLFTANSQVVQNYSPQIKIQTRKRKTQILWRLLESHPRQHICQVRQNRPHSGPASGAMTFQNTRAEKY